MYFPKFSKKLLVSSSVVKLSSKTQTCGRLKRDGNCDKLIGVIVYMSQTTRETETCLNSSAKINVRLNESEASCLFFCSVIDVTVYINDNKRADIYLLGHKCVKLLFMSQHTVDFYSKLNCGRPFYYIMFSVILNF